MQVWRVYKTTLRFDNSLERLTDNCYTHLYGLLQERSIKIYVLLKSAKGRSSPDRVQEKDQIRSQDALLSQHSGVTVYTVIAYRRSPSEPQCSEILLGLQYIYMID